MLGTPRHRYTQDISRTGLQRAGQRGAGEEQGGVRSRTDNLNVVPANDGGSDRLLPVLIHWLALLDKRRHAFGAILQREGGVKQVAFDVKSFAERRLERAVDVALRHLRC